jgi:hypothetical protein
MKRNSGAVGLGRVPGIVQLAPVAGDEGDFGAGGARSGVRDLEQGLHQDGQGGVFVLEETPGGLRGGEGVGGIRQGADAGGDILQGGGVTLHEILVTVLKSLF